VTELIDICNQNTSLTQLSLSGNEIDDQSISSIANALSTNTSLKQLDLSLNNIAIAKPFFLLLDCKMKATIDLSGNKISGDEVDLFTLKNFTRVIFGI